jgi:hypothetical protein
MDIRYHRHQAFQGHDGLRRFFAEWLQAFPDSSVEVEDVEQRGEWTMTLVLHAANSAAVLSTE